MQTLTLCESVFRAKLHPSDGKPLKSLNSSLPASLSLKKSKHSHENSRLRSSRYSSPQTQYANVDEDLLWKFPRSSAADLQSYELRFLDDKSSNSRYLADGSPRSEAPSSSSLEHDASPISSASFHNWLKLAALFGLLTFQGTQQAMAGSEFVSGMQSIPYIGDFGDISTGFASALLAARNSGAVVFIGTFGALAAMTIISVVLGRTFHYIDDILPFRLGETDLPIDDIAAVCLLVYFGVSTLLEAASSDGLKAEEEQKEAELAVSDFSGNGAGLLSAANTVISTFALVFVAEWGDKSFFSTIALAAASSPLGVIGGALAGHAVATLVAVLGGSLLGTFFSEKVIAYVGGSLFLVFAVATLIEIVS